ncbi:MAG: UDP-4-amino-4,6-dideoxy-N-acetyl-beta-L-altrosamine N-acetyltransferase [Sulfuricurvum sp.]|nr:UDP-4-amino-4,6-dideoxy-N-acetyl-beta-L-altrosamine N-acetyltransferase [Sulfuricurvum sp.]
MDNVTAFTKLSPIQKEIVLSWRNHENVRKWMIDSEPISLSRHLEFVDSLNDTDTKHYFLVKDYGVIYFTHINYDEKSAHIGLYANPYSKVFGKGAFLMNKILSIAFHNLHLDILKLEVFSDNQRAIQLYEHFKFIQTGTVPFGNRSMTTMELAHKR